jgi:hypothetical protein
MSSTVSKASQSPRGMADLERLERIRAVLTGRGVDAEGAMLLLFGRSGFSSGLVAAAGRRADVELVDLDRLYAMS